MRERRYYVYIMASRSLTLYTGITSDICRRALEHKSGAIEGFTKKYHIDRLVYYETFQYVGNAIAREKQIKAWTRAKRIALIKTMNPAWQDLAEGWGERIELQIPRFARDDNQVGEREGGEGKAPTTSRPAQGRRYFNSKGLIPWRQLRCLRGKWKKRKRSLARNMSISSAAAKPTATAK